jgi:hypothetical protein
MRRRGVFLAVALAGALAAAGALGAGSQPPAPSVRAADGGKTVYVYDSNSSSNGFDHNCKGWIWSELGFLDANGKPAAEGAKKGDQIKVGDEVRGSVISDAKGKANGYGSADGTKEAFDLSRGATLKQAYQRLKKDDRLVICKHGGSHSHVVPGGDTKTHQGGLIHLDGGEKFTGFKEENTKGQGTNVNQQGERPVGAPYVLPPPPSGKGTVTATIYSCWGDKVPGTGERSVKQSLEDVLGKGTVTAFDGVVKSKLAWKVDVENAADEQEAKTLEELAKKRLSEAATKAGFPDDPDGWLTNTPFEDQYKAANDAVAKDPKLKGKVTVSFEYPTPDPPVLVGPGSECPRFVLGGGVRLTYGTPAAILVLPQHSLGRLALDMLLLQPDATTLPAGPGPLQSPVIEVARARDGNPELRTKLKRKGQIILPYFPVDTIPEIYQLQGGRWVHLPTDLDKSAMRVSARIGRLGTFAAFVTPPRAVTIDEDDTWAHNASLGVSKICINVRTTPPQAAATVTLAGPDGTHFSSPPKTPLAHGAAQFTAPITVAGQYTKTITVYDANGVQTATVTKTFTVSQPPVDGPPATPACTAPTSTG